MTKTARKPFIIVVIVRRKVKLIYKDRICYDFVNGGIWNREAPDRKRNVRRDRLLPDRAQID